MKDLDLDRFRPPAGAPVRLDRFDPRDLGGLDGDEEAVKKAAKRWTKKAQKKLQERQQCLYAEQKHALLVVLQAMDAGGKDGTIRHVMGAFDPQGVRVTPFKQPTEEELAHDFLWRVHKATPRRGMVGIFNRSHYEDVLVVRVRELVPEEVWRQRYEHINHFEKLLADSGVTLVKLFLHLSPEEQAERFRDRQRRPDKQWKFTPGDVEDRELWHDFQVAYEEALTRCNTPWAPWHVIPADRKWFRNLVVSRLLLETLRGLDCKYPEPVPDIESYVIGDLPPRKG